MPASLSPRAIASANAQSTEEVWLVLLTIAHPDLVDEEGNPTTIRVVNNFDNITSADPDTGEARLFIGLPFQIELPGEDSDDPVMATIRVDNVDRQITAAVRSLTSPPTCSMEVILASQPDVIEIGFYDATMRSATYDNLYVDAQLTFEQIYTEPVAETITPARFPASF